MKHYIAVFWNDDIDDIIGVGQPEESAKKAIDAARNDFSGDLNDLIVLEFDYTVPKKDKEPKYKLIKLCGKK